MDLKYLDELAEANGQCKTPGWWGRLRLGIGRNGTWVCPRCATIWKWRYWGYSDMCAWEKMVLMGGRGLDVAHNVIDISVVQPSEDAGALWDHLEHDHRWKTKTSTSTGSELFRIHFQTHHEATVASEHMLRGHVEHQCQYREALEGLVKEPEDLMAMKVDAVRDRLGL
jgi:hypothetical protein